MKLVDYEKYYHSGSEFIIPRDEFEKIIEKNQRLKERIEYLERSNNRREDTIISLRDEITEQKDYENILNELKEWFKEFHKYHSRLKWNEEDYIEFIEHLENELKESDKQ